jgi:hypothetical protein
VLFILYSISVVLMITILCIYAVPNMDCFEGHLHAKKYISREQALSKTRNENEDEDFDPD